MVKSVEQINRDLAGLEQQSQDLAKELRSLYDNYLDELGKTAYQRMISVCYQLCTQAFPDLFLKLSMGDRDRLQRSIKEESQSLQEQLDLTSLLKMADESSRLEASLLEEVQKISAKRSRQDSLMEDLAALDLSEDGLAEFSDLVPSETDEVPQNRGGDDSKREDSEENDSRKDDSEQGLNTRETDGPAPGEENALSEENSLEAAKPSDSPPLDSQPPDSQPLDSTEEANSSPSTELPITIIHAGEGPISAGMIASAIAAEADDENSSPDSQRLLLGLAPSEAASIEPQADPRTPSELRAWHERLERRISQRLRRSSQAMTRLLEKSGVLNNQLPDGLLAAVPESREEEPEEMRRREPSHPRDEMDLQAPGSPHILNLTLESADGGKKKRKGTQIQIVAIYLRLAELEFEAPMLMGRRNQIRSQLKKLRQLERSYRQKQRERAIAEAEDAWRSTWSNS